MNIFSGHMPVLDDWHVLLDLLGVFGFGLYVASYLLLATRRLSGEAVAYYALNFAAAGLVMISLIASFNLASLLIQIFWIAISIFGIVITLMRPAHKMTVAITRRLGRPPRVPGRAGPGHVSIIDAIFSDADRICIEIEGTDLTAEHHEVELTSRPGGRGVDIWLDGTLVAHVENAETLRPGQISLIARAPLEGDGKVHWLTA